MLNENRLAESQSISFPGCNFTTEFGTLRLPMQSTLVGVPPDVDFQVRVIDKDFSTRPIEAIAPTSGKQKDSFFPTRLVEIREAGWIRENRVLPIQLNPVQYNPVRREVRLYHRLVVEVGFRGNEVTSPLQMSAKPTVLSTTPLGSHTESRAYDAFFADMLVNPTECQEVAFFPPFHLRIEHLRHRASRSQAPAIELVSPNPVCIALRHRISQPPV